MKKKEKKSKVKVDKTSGNHRSHELIVLVLYFQLFFVLDHFFNFWSIFFAGETYVLFLDRNFNNENGGKMQNKKDIMTDEPGFIVSLPQV